MSTPYFIRNGTKYISGETYQVDGLNIRFDLRKDKIVLTLEPIAPGNGLKFSRIRTILGGDFTYASDKLTSGAVKTYTQFAAAQKGETFEETAVSYNLKTGANISSPFEQTYSLPKDASSVNYYYASLPNDSIGQGQFTSVPTIHNRALLQGLTDSNLAPDGWWNSPFSTYTITPSKSSINEGETLTTTIETTGVPKDTVVYWILTGTAADTARFANTSASISNALTGTGTTDSNGKFQIVKSILADNKTQGATQLTVTLYSDAARTKQVGTTGITTVTVNDTSTTPAAITKQISPSNLSDLLGRYGDQLSNADTGTSNIQGGGFGTQWAYYINQATASQYGSISSRFDSAFKGVTGKSFQEASAAIDPQLKINGSQLAVVQKLPNGLVLGAGNAKNEGLIYNPKLGKSYLLPSVGTSQEGTKLWALPQVAHKDDLYAGNSQTVVGGNPKNAILYSYKTDGSLKWLKTFTSGSTLNNTWIGGGHQLTILPNGNVAIAWQGNSVNVGNANAWDSTISILSSADGSLITQNTLAGSDYVNLYCSGDGTLWGVSRNDYKTPIKILSSATAYNNSKPSDLRGDIGGFTKDGDFITTAAKKNNSSDFTTTIIKSADLPYLSTTFGNFSTTAAKDTLTGTSFADTFAFSTTPNYSSNGANSDVITNFNPTEGDLIKLSKSAFGISSGGLSPTFAQVNSASALTTQLGSTTQIVYDQSSGFLYNNQDGALTNGCGSGGGIFAVLTGKPTLSSSNLQFI